MRCWGSLCSRRVKSLRASSAIASVLRMTRRSRRLRAGYGRTASSGHCVHWPDDRDDPYEGCWASNARGRCATCGWPSSRATSKWAWSSSGRRWSARPAVRRVGGMTVGGGLASPGHDAVRTLVWAEVPRVRCTEHGVQQVAGAVGGCAGAFDGDVRGDGHRLAAGSELRGGGPAVSVELGLGVRDPGTGGATGTVASRSGRVAGGRGRRDVVSTAARIRDRGQ